MPVCWFTQVQSRMGRAHSADMGSYFFGMALMYRIFCRAGFHTCSTHLLWLLKHLTR